MSEEAGADELVTAAIIVIGDEILSGRTKDKNVGYIAEHMTQIGIQVKQVRIVADDEDDIVEAVNTLRARYTYVFTTGGIGPTHDDITADCIAKAFGVPLDVDPRALAIIKPHYERRGVEITPARLRMARVPAAAKIIENSLSFAPGFMMENVIVMAGIPGVMQVMLDAAIPLLKTGKKMQSVTMDLFRPEGDIAGPLGAHQERYPTVSMGSYPFFRDTKLGTQLVLRSTDPELLAKAEAELKAELQSRGWL